ncbi:L-lactate permease [Sphingomonas sp. dw_22]|uniref:L-lactate permease n=1 Tax=Sphingomonas sp. dw_22 TaxID=2721175 RepID=UPI001BD266DA
MSWTQTYSPLGSPFASVAISALPILALLAAIAVFRVRAHLAALLGLGIALAVAVFAYGMPTRLAAGAALLGAGYGLLPIGWLVLNVLFLYRLTVERGLFQRLQIQVAGITPDRRLQLLLIAFCFGAFFEGCAGFGAPVAITGAMLVGLGFAPVGASRLALIANTAPVAFGSLGTPILALSAASGLPLLQLSAMVGRQLPFFSLLVPFWLVAAFAGFRGMREVWPAILVAGLAFAIPQFLVSNFHGPWLVDVASSLASIGCLALFLRHWQPARMWSAVEGRDAGASVEHVAAGIDWRAWMPWLILSLGVFLWGLPDTKAFLDGLFAPKLPMPWLDGAVVRMPPVVSTPHAEPAVFVFNILSATGTGILLSAIVAGFAMGASPRAMVATWLATLRLALLPLLTIAAMLALGYVTRYAGMDSVIGLALAQSGFLYPFFGTLLGWLGVAATGSDTASNALFGGLQRTTAEQLGISPVLMVAANSSGGVMGKMADAQSIVVAATATGIRGREAEILRYVLFHSVVLAALVGLLVMGQAYIWPLTNMVVK